MHITLGIVTPVVYISHYCAPCCSKVKSFVISKSYQIIFRTVTLRNIRNRFAECD